MPGGAEQHAANLVPSHEEAMAVQRATVDALVNDHVPPELVETYMPALLAAASLVPSDDEAISFQISLGALVKVQVLPRLVET